MARGAETQGAMDQSHFVDALTMYINDVVEGQLKTELEAAETATNQLRERVVALTTDSTNVKSQLTEKTKHAQRLDDRVVALVSEFKAAKAKVAAKNSVTTALEDEVVALKTASHKKSPRCQTRATRSGFGCASSVSSSVLSMRRSCCLEWPRSGQKTTLSRTPRPIGDTLSSY
ncbi:unnamed protein product [Aphanomyces euteiches]|uniref:Uncharacterized protein n=1 Tax=Aphanomyces euteiches TaxID=100861 RepID=A0A6G0XY93_9STRA|nr:hypothetical protein Ae201684_000047 [Aphanomyces euteiches]KAH9091788.1 hypothetical protein Ae201684P_011332 [Aphanomyces euteiches]KAH9155937.1 hypothetical protein AeRB84_002131 [Aphanomyces euteiches]